MNYEILVWIFIVILIIIGIVLFIEIENINSKIIKDKNRGNRTLKKVKFSIFFMFIVTQIPYNHSYSLHSDKEMFTKFKTPQIDSTMYLSDLNKDRNFYCSTNTDSAIHFIKRIDYDLFTIDKITDFIYNRKLELRLELTFIKSSIFRNEKRIYKLTRHEKGQDVLVAKLNEYQKDSVLKVWGFTEQLYKEDKRH